MRRKPKNTQCQGVEGYNWSRLRADSAKMLDNVSPRLRPSVIAWPTWHTTVTVDTSVGARQSRRIRKLILAKLCIYKTVRVDTNVVALICWTLE